MRYLVSSCYRVQRVRPAAMLGFSGFRLALGFSGFLVGSICFDALMGDSEHASRAGSLHFLLPNFS